MSDCGAGRLSQTARIAALTSVTLIVSALLSLALCARAEAITLPGHAGQCPQLAVNSPDKQCVAALQRVLNSQNIRPPLKVDGIFSTLTFNNVKQFQKREGLPQDGTVGPKTAVDLTLAWQHSLAAGKKRAAQPPSASTPKASNGPPAPASRSFFGLNLQETIVILIFVLLVLVIAVFGRRLRRVKIVITRHFMIHLSLARTEAENDLEALKVLERVWEVTTADKVAESYLQVVQTLKETNAMRSSDEKQRGIRFRKQPKMITGRVEKDDWILSSSIMLTSTSL